MRIVDGRLAGIGLATAILTLGAAARDYYCAPDGTGDYLSSSTPGPNPNYCARNLAKTSGDVIHLAAGTYVLGGDAPAVNPQIFLQRGVKVIGATDDPADTVIDADGKSRAFCCTYESQVRNLTMRNCATGDERDANDALRSGIGFGGAVCAQSDGQPSYVISNCVVDGCTSIYRGGGGSHGIWYDCVIRNCRVTYPGYKMEVNGKNELIEPRSEGSGGGVWAGTLYNCVVTNNYAAFAGGGVAGGGDSRDKCRAYNCLIGWNDASMGGGCGVRGGTDVSQCRLEGCTIVSNMTHALKNYSADKGGGSDGCTLTNCVVRGNRTANEGGGLNRCHAVDCRIEGNVSTYSYSDRGGGGAANGTLVACVVVSNTVVSEGGGLFNVTASNCVIEANQTTHTGTSGYGGGGAFGGTLTRCTVRNNRAWYTGAGIYKSFAQDSLIVSNVLTATATSGQETTGGAGAGASALLRCEVRDNDAGIVFFGGGLRSCGVTNCVVAGNRGPYGGGYDCDFVDCIITNNLAWQRSGGGVYRGTTRNCVIAFNYTTNNVVPDGNALTGRGAICRGYHVGDLVYSNYYAKGAAVTCGIGSNDITIVNCTVYGNRSIYDANHNGFNCGYATNCIIVGHPNTDVYNIKALVNCFWQEDMVTHGQTDATLALALNCIHGHGLDPRLDVAPTNGVLAVRVTNRSPCRNAGLAFDWMTNAVDLAGSPRICGKAPDIGAFEYPIERQATFMIVR